MAKKVKDVTGTIEFRRFFDQIPEKDSRKKEFREIFKILKEDCLRGDRIPSNRWPRVYVKKYKIKNLMRMPLSTGWRLVYTILSEDDGFVVCIIEAFSHSEYEKRFGY